MRPGAVASELTPAMVFVDNPRCVYHLDAGLINRFPHKKIIIGDRGLKNEAYFSAHDLLLTCALMDTEALAQLQHEIARHYRVEAVFGFTETSVYASAFLAEAFAVPGIGLAVARRCRDKLAMIEALKAADVLTPHYFLSRADTPPEAPEPISHVAQTLDQVRRIGGFPVVAKPLSGFAGCGVICADDGPALIKALSRIRRNNRFTMQKYYPDAAGAGDVLIQSFISGQEVAVDGYVRQGKAHILAIIDKPDVSQGPYFADKMHVLPSAIGGDLEDRLADTAQRCVSALGLDNSLFHLEARICQGRIHVLEIAARVGFMASIQDALGLDLCAIAIALNLGEAPPIRPTRQRFAGNYCLTAERLGYFRELRHLDRVMADPRIAAVPLFVQPGDRVAPAPDSNGYIGYILAAADSHQDVVSALQKAVREIEIILY